MILPQPRYGSILLIMALWLAGAAGARADSGFRIAQDAPGKIDALLLASVPWQGLTTVCSILVDIVGESAYEKHIGLADIENRVVPTSDTVYQVGSISKSYTAQAVLQLVGQGRVDLDGPIGDYLPAGQKIMTWVPTTRGDILALVEDEPLDFEPGTNWNYSNTGYYLLGLIVEAVSG